MNYRLFASLALGTGLAVAGSTALAQTTDEKKKSPADTVTQPLGTADDKSGDKSNDPLSTGTGNTGSRSVSFGGLDVNMDNKLSRDEIKADNSLTADFDKLDKDRNGSLSDSEFAAFESDSGNKAEKKGDKAEDKS